MRWLPLLHMRVLIQLLLEKPMAAEAQIPAAESTSHAHQTQPFNIQR